MYIKDSVMLSNRGAPRGGVLGVETPLFWK